MHTTGSRERDLLIAYANLPFMHAGRVALLRDTTATIEGGRPLSPDQLRDLLRIDAAQARIVYDPFSLPSIARAVEAQRAEVITILDDDYPPLLREIDSPPPLLHVAGNREALLRPGLAIVGSRRATPYGVNVARRLARDLSSCGFNIVSGFARGIDAAAHDEALQAGGTTTAILGTGIDVDYPRGQRALRRRIEEGGAVVTEFSPGTPPVAMNFPVRNRIIAGLSLGTIVVEATERSGSLITARLACEQGREVFAVPGSIFSPASEGTHRLIQLGAKLVRNIDDIGEELGAFFELRKREARDCSITEEQRAVLKTLSFEEGTHIDLLASQLNVPHGVLAEVVLQLEMSGMIRALPGQRYVKAG